MKSPFKKRAANGYKSTVTMPCICLPTQRLRRAPVESILKLVLASIALALEIATGIPHPEPHKPTEMPAMTSGSSSHGGEHHEHEHNHGSSPHVVKYWPVSAGNTQHVTMYSSFILGSIVEILMHYGFVLPYGMDYACGALAFFNEGFLFSSHLHGKVLVDAYVHQLLVYAIGGCLLAGVLEFANRGQILWTYCRCLFTILQGTWFFQVGFMISDYGFFGVWDLESHESIVFASIAFCWHLILIVAFLLIQLSVVRYLVIKCDWKCLDDLVYIDYLNMDNGDEFEKSGGSGSGSNRYANTSFSNGHVSNGETKLLTEFDSENDDMDDDLNERIVFSKK